MNTRRSAILYGMLSRYTMKRGVKAADLPAGVRQDTRKHTRHVLRPEPELVTRYFDGIIDWTSFCALYQAVIKARFRADPRPFEALAELARHNDVYLGCSCPTRRNPDVRHCHTRLALEFMQAQFPDLDVRFGAEDGS